MSFDLHIDTDNAAFADDLGPAIYDCLNYVARKIDHGQLDGTILDENGNSVGTYAYAPEVNQDFVDRFAPVVEAAAIEAGILPGPAKLDPNWTPPFYAGPPAVDHRDGTPWIAQSGAECNRRAGEFRVGDVVRGGNGYGPAERRIVTLDRLVTKVDQFFDSGARRHYVILHSTDTRGGRNVSTYVKSEKLRSYRR